LANITKPVDINKIWSATGDILAPPDSKIQAGWQIEIPPRQYFNYIDNKQDQAIAHINQHGIAVWDNLTEYQWSTNGLKSLAMGSNGSIYRSKAISTGQDPVTDTAGTYWELAFASVADVYSKSQVDAKTTLATTAQAQAQTSANTLMSPSLLNLALKGANQSLLANGYQKLPGGIIMQWGTNVLSAAGTTVTFPTPFANQCWHVFITDNDAVSVDSFAAGTKTLTTFIGRVSGTDDRGASWFAIGF